MTVDKQHDTIPPQKVNRRRAALTVLVGGNINSAITVVFGLVTIPIYLHYIGSRLYGAWVGSGEIVTWLSVLEVGLASVMIQRMAKAYGNQERQKVAEYFASGFLLQVCLISLIVLLALIVSVFVPRWMEISGSDARVLSGSFVLAALGTGLTFINNGIVGFAMALQRTLFYNVMNIIGTILRFSLTLFLLYHGHGLWSIPIGVLAKAILLVTANSIHAIWLFGTEIHAPFRPTRRVMRDLAIISPALFFSKLGNALSQRTEVALIAVFIKPEMATVYSLTRRVAELLQTFLDHFGGATFGGFAHLVGEGNRTRAAQIHTEVMSLYSFVALLFFSVYMALNHTFINLWVGSDQFGGQVLTILIGLSTFTAGRSQVMTYLYGATGRLIQSSYLVFAESLFRLPLLLIVLATAGVEFAPLPKLITSFVVAEIALHVTFRELTGENATTNKGGRRVTLVLFTVIITTASVIGFFVLTESWFVLAIVAALLCSVFGVIIIILDLRARHIAKSIRGKTHRFVARWTRQFSARLTGAGVK
ncbi:MAG: lipopolysaccharide biosynthesis protein [Anaerolineae bacterium]|nr:lipopolysaccharide biosynthesis protein [Anaerolineae bacterium]